ncbi:hypothetical protein [Pseudomonas sp. NUPR-001]|uniref:hypothetical protein n=1 Tax=Pseudomonas sp. NUPR-001 TaxID=3416058 RepID=UPI003F9817CC
MIDLVHAQFIATGMIFDDRHQGAGSHALHGLTLEQGWAWFICVLTGGVYENEAGPQYNDG